MSIKNQYYKTLQNIDKVLLDYFTFDKDYKNKFVSLYDFIKNQNETKYIKKMELFDFIIHIKFMKVKSQLNIDLRYITPGYNILSYSCVCPLYLYLDKLTRFIDKKTNQLDDTLIEYLIEDLCVFMNNFIYNDKD